MDRSGNVAAVCSFDKWLSRQACLGTYGGMVGGSLYDSADAFGTAWGCEEGGYASLWDVTKSGFGAAVNVVSTALFLRGLLAPALAPTEAPPAAPEQPGRTVTDFHKGYLQVGEVVARIKPFSTATSAEDVEAVVPGGAPVHQFDIPEEVMQEWEASGQATRWRTLMRGRTIDEIRFGPRAQGLLQQYQVGR